MTSRTFLVKNKPPFLVKLRALSNPNLGCRAVGRQKNYRQRGEICGGCCCCCCFGGVVVGVVWCWGGVVLVYWGVVVGVWCALSVLLGVVCAVLLGWFCCFYVCFVVVVVLGVGGGAVVAVWLVF